MAEQYYATQRLKGDGTTTVWPFSFAGGRPDSNSGTSPYLEPEDVQVAKVDFDADGNETRTPIDFSLQGQDQVRLIPAIADGQDFVIYRVTETDTPVSDFTDFASISERDLDNALRQTLFSVQELSDTSQDTRTFAANAQSRAADALAVASGADDTADNALDVAQSARSTANTAISTANAADDTANIADAKADRATDTANNALSEAGKATDSVAGAVLAADQAKASAESAETSADRAGVQAASAEASADAAEIQARNAASVAESAEQAANEAVNTANSAESAAEAAGTKAEAAEQKAAEVETFGGRLDDLAFRVEQLVGADVSEFLLAGDNLAGIASAEAARSNIDVYSTLEVDTAITQAVSPVADDAGQALTTAQDAAGQVSTLADTVSANTTAVSEKLDKTASATDSAKLGGNPPGYYQNAGNLSTGTVPKARLAGDYSINNTGTFGGIPPEGYERAGGGVPKGVIVMWGGRVSDVPDGWAICDGKNGTPNLIDKFIKGGSPGSTGGNKNTTLSVGNLPAHNHSASTSSAGNHGHSASTSPAGAHGHDLLGADSAARDTPLRGANPVLVAWTLRTADTEYYEGTGYKGKRFVSNAGNHSHSVNIGAAGSHRHTVSVGNTGMGGAFSNEPQYYTLAYIQKL